MDWLSVYFAAKNICHFLDKLSAAHCRFKTLARPVEPLLDFVYGLLGFTEFYLPFEDAELSKLSLYQRNLTSCLW